MKWKQGLPTFTPELLWSYSWFHLLLKKLPHNWAPSPVKRVSGFAPVASHPDLVNRYGISVSLMTKDMFCVLLFYFMIYYWICNKSNTTGATSETETAYSLRDTSIGKPRVSPLTVSGAHEITPCFKCDSYWAIFNFLCIVL